MRTPLRNRRALPDRANLLPHQNARALYSMAHANLAVRAQSGASTAHFAAFETSPIPPRGEVSKSATGGKRRGGARNRADRTSDGLTTKQIANLIAAASMAGWIGLPLNRFITIHWVAAGVPLADMAKATGRFVGLLTGWLRRRGFGTAWLWVHENGNGMGGHCHLIVHVPPELVVDLPGAQKRWLRKITSRPYRAKVIKSEPVGGWLGLEANSPDLHVANLETVIAYVIKQSVAAAVATTRFHERGGHVIGKRCGTSQNIGAKARSSKSGE